MSTGVVNPFQGLKKDDILLELETRGIWSNDERKCAVQEKLNEVLHEIARPSALYCLDPTKTTSNLNIDSYEVLACEPLHDLTNVIQNLIQEQPHHVGDNNKQEFLSFSDTTIGNKNQLKGSDASFMPSSSKNSHFRNLKRARLKKPFQILQILLLKLSLSATLIFPLVLRNNFFDYTTNAFYLAFFAKQ